MTLFLETPELTTAGREYWHGVLTAGGFTALPRWARDPVPGVARLEVPIVDDDPLPVAGCTAEPAALPSVLLAAHARVLAALSGEREVVTGYVPAPGRAPLPCRLTTAAGSWRAVVADTLRAESQVLAHANFPVDDLRRELGLATPAFETVFDPTGSAGAPGDPALDGDTVLRVGLLRRGGRTALVLDHRTDVLDAECAARIAGYHLTALALITDDPDAAHARQTLLSSEELRFQLEDLAGPRRELPGRRVHELFEDRVERHPDAVAAVHGDRSWTYRELNARANRLGRALRARGLPREAIVTVVMERDLDWMASVLGIWKAGCAYLPLEPHFPAERIATAVGRAGSTIVLTEHGSTATLDAALAGLHGVERVLVDAAYAEGRSEENLGIEVTADQLAYLLFTSGSTGEPKGAMCEHAGMLNHILAKLADLQVGEGEVIPQTGPQCFDISVWQLVGALLVGGQTLLVAQEAILDVARFVDMVVEGRAGVFQVVPSYLEVVVSYLEQHPRALPDLHAVSPTGDFLKKELVQRWFAVKPGVRLVNTYGLTETSDDAVHEVMEATPDRERIPLGRPIDNVHVDVVDEAHNPVPLGAPGLIVFSGVCVGRGYVNDPARTEAMFGADPHRPGLRVCRTGDYGRWLPDGTLDFLGRRDNQVKIRGFRIEIGEIENALLHVPGVRDGAVVVAGRAGRDARLVAFYSAASPVEPDVLRDRLAQRLPEYMVPAVLAWRDALPLTPNGKIDRTALTALAGEVDAAANTASDTADGHDTPRTPTERRLAAAWAEVLGIPQDRIGRRDHFFDRGGSSLSAVQLVVALNRTLSLKDVVRHPVLADLAGALDGAAPRRNGRARRPTGPPTS
jgi:amino acid adenylation domain-containing protein